MGERARYAKSGTAGCYMDGNRDIWRDAASAFAHQLNGLSGGAVMSRLEQVFLFASAIDITAVGDPRQHTYANQPEP